MVNKGGIRVRHFYIGIATAALALPALVGFVGNSSAVAGPASLHTSWRAVRESAVDGGGTLSSVSCPSAKQCVSVGTDASGNFVAALWNGRRWKSLRVPEVPMEGDNLLPGVSCPAVDDCEVAGGTQTSTGVSHTVALSWNGHKFKRQPLPYAPASSHPYVGDGGARLSGISCGSTDSCLAVGYSSTSHAQDDLALAYNGRRWKRLSPKELSSSANSFSSVSCASATSCDAIGYNGGDGGVIESWSGGKNFRNVPDPSATAAGIALIQISCVAPGKCFVVGSKSGTKGVVGSLSAGRVRFKEQGTGDAFYAVDCLSSQTCYVAGQTTGEKILAGKTSGLHVSVGHTPGIHGVLFGVGCSTSENCFAVGDDGAGGKSVMIQTR